MDVFKGIDIGTYSHFRNMGIDHPELVQVMHGSAIAGQFLWIFFLTILVWRWRADLGRFPLGNLVKVLVIFAVVEGLSFALHRPRPVDAEDFFDALVQHGFPNEPSFRALFLNHGFPNVPSFRAVLISALMWETTKPGAGRWLGLLGAMLYCVWVMMGQLMVHLGFLTDILGSLALALGIGLLAPRFFEMRVPRRVI